MTLIACRKVGTWADFCSNLLVMKLTGILLLILALNFTASAISQTVSLSEKNTSLEKIFGKIKAQTGYSFVYKPQLVTNAHKVTISVNGATVNEVMQLCLKGQSLSYTIMNSMIIIRGKEEEKEEQTEAVKEVYYTPPPVVVKGTVTSETGEVLAGVTVNEKGTGNAVVTNAQGVFTITVSNANATLIVTFVGYEVKETSVAQGTTLSIALKPLKNNLDEVIVVGYGTKTRGTVTSSIVSVGAEEIRSRPVANALQAIQGKAAGVDVTSNERPGEMGSILIRGVRSINASNSPLYVVDGIPLNFGGVEAVNPNDIESIDILKDASATAIYGSRGANGVVLISTKRGKNGKLSTSYVGTLTIESLQNRQEMMNAGEYVEFRRDAYRRIRYLNPAANATTTYPDQPTLADDQRIFGQDPIAFANIQKGWAGGTWNPSLVPTTDWTGYATQTGITQDHVISVSGGSQNVKGYGSFGYLKNKGTQVGQDFTRYSGKFSVDLTASKWFSMGGSVNTTYGLQNYGYSTTNATGPGTIFAAAQGMLPYAAPFDSTGKRITLPGGDINILNPVQENDYNVNLRKNLRILGSVYAEAKLAKGLKFRVNFGPDFQSYMNGRWMDANSINRGAGNPGSTNYAQLNQTSRVSWTLDNLLYYDKTIRSSRHTHDLGFTFLQSSAYTRTETSSMTATKLPWNSQKWYRLNSVAALDAFSTNLVENSLTSYMGRVNYSLDQKYLLTAFVRWDGASPLADGNKWDMFPSVSLGWRMEKENFMKNATWVNQLKLRLGIASVGNAAVDPYTTLGALQPLYYTWGSAVQLGYVPSDPSAADPITYPDRNLGWEHTSQVNLGLDFSLFNNRITGTLDVYKTSTTDLLMSRVIPSVTGYTRMLTNIGETSGKGFDLSVTSSNVVKKDFSWSSTLNLSASREKISRLANGKVDDINNRWFIGQRISVYYDYDKERIWQNTPEDLAEIAKYKATSNQTFNPGDIKIVDQDRNYKIDANDRVLRGHSQPNLVGGITNDFTYKNWGLSVFIFSRLGFQRELGAESLQGRFAQRKLTYWTPSNASNDYQAPNYGSAAGDAFRSSMNYQNSSFIKIRNITLSYNLPGATASRWHMTNLKVYAQALNPGLIYSAISYVDPDTGGSVFNRGFVLGVNASF